MFEAFVEAETGTFLAFFSRLGAGAEEAEDLTQELFLKLFKNATAYQAQSHFPAFVMRIAKNAWIDRGRRRTARPGVQSLSGAGQGDAGAGRAESLEQRLAGPVLDPAGSLTQREDLAKFRAALAQLSAGQREVFELAVLQEVPYAEVAQIVGIPIGTVKSRVFHALRKLREGMEESA